MGKAKMKPQFFRHRIKIAALAAAFLAAPAFGGQLSKDLANVPSGTSVDAIVQFKAAPTAAMLDKVKVKGGALKKQHVNVLKDVGVGRAVCHAGAGETVKRGLCVSGPGDQRLA